MSRLCVIKRFVLLTVVCALVAPSAATAGGPQAPGGGCPEGFCEPGNPPRKFCESDQVPQSIAHPLCFSSADTQDSDFSDDLPTPTPTPTPIPNRPAAPTDTRPSGFAHGAVTGRPAAVQVVNGSRRF